MGRINGIGKTLLGLRRSDRKDPNAGHATEWFTFIFLPITPLRRLHIRIAPKQKGSGVAYRELGTTPLNWSEVVVTYLTGWVIWPALFIGPMAWSVISGIGGEVFWGLYGGGLAIGAMFFRDWRYRYVEDPTRERLERAVRSIGQVLLRAGVSGGGADITVTHIGYLLAAKMIAADGQVRGDEILAAGLIGQKLFPDFSVDALGRVVPHAKDIPTASTMAELVRDTLSTEGRGAILEFIRAIANVDGDLAKEEAGMLGELERMLR